MQPLKFWQIILKLLLMIYIHLPRLILKNSEIATLISSQQVMSEMGCIPQ